MRTVTILIDVQSVAYQIETVLIQRLVGRLVLPKEQGPKGLLVRTKITVKRVIEQDPSMMDQVPSGDNYPHGCSIHILHRQGPILC